MNACREILYRDYSASFGRQKEMAPAVQQAQYEAVYKTLPADRQAAIADLGCGKGEWLTWLAEKGFTALTGVDGSTSDIEIARRHGAGAVQWLKQDVRAFLQSHPSSFDVLHAKDLVEHLTKDEFIGFLQDAHQALRPGGQIWLLTFNAQSPLAAATRYGDFTHEIGLTPASFAQCLRACGFTTIAIRGFHYCSQSAGGRLRAALGGVIYSAARLLLGIRHGAGSGRDSDIDLHTASPDLFVRAMKGPAS